MSILLYVLVPVLVVAVVAAGMWVRNRQPTSLESGVDAFQREMNALSPDAAPMRRRRPDGTPMDGPNRPEPPTQRPGPRRPSSPNRPR